MINGFYVGGRLSDTILLVFPSPESPEAGSPDVAWNLFSLKQFLCSLKLNDVEKKTNINL